MNNCLIKSNYMKKHVLNIKNSKKSNKVILVIKQINNYNMYW